MKINCSGPVNIVAAFSFCDMVVNIENIAGNEKRVGAKENVEVT